MSKYIRFLGCDGDGGVEVVRENPVAVGEVVRRVLVADIDAELGLITCVWSRIGQIARHSTPWSRSVGGLLVPVSGVDEGEGRVRDGRDGTRKRDMIQR